MAGRFTTERSLFSPAYSSIMSVGSVAWWAWIRKRGEVVLLGISIAIDEPKPAPLLNVSVDGRALTRAIIEFVGERGPEVFTATTASRIIPVPPGGIGGVATNPRVP